VARVYVFSSVVAEVQDGRVRIVIEEPCELVELSRFRELADPRALRERVAELKRLVAERLDDSVVLASGDSPIRMGGGFAQLEEPGGRLLLVRRGADAPRMPLALDISAGLFDEEWDNPLQMMAGEAVEIVRVMGSVFYYPCLVRDERVRREAEAVAEALRMEGVRVDSVEGLPSEIVPLRTPVLEVRYMGEVYRGFGVAFEYGGANRRDASLELIGLLRVRVEGRSFRYAFGEVVNGRLLKNEILSVDLTARRAEVWRMLQLERVASFDEELEKRSRGFTSKAALVAASLGLAPNVASEDWDVLF
jgi:hypothetical protein